MNSNSTFNQGKLPANATSSGEVGAATPRNLVNAYNMDGAFNDAQEYADATRALPENFMSEPLPVDYANGLRGFARNLATLMSDHIEERARVSRARGNLAGSMDGANDNEDFDRGDLEFGNFETDLPYPDHANGFQERAHGNLAAGMDGADDREEPARGYFAGNMYGANGGEDLGPGNLDPADYGSEFQEFARGHLAADEPGEFESYEFNREMMDSDEELEPPTVPDALKAPALVWSALETGVQVIIFEVFTQRGYTFEDVVALMGMNDAEADAFVKLHAAGYDRTSMMDVYHQEVIDFQVGETLAGRNWEDHRSESGQTLHEQLAEIQNTPAYSITQDGLERGYQYVWQLGASDERLRGFLDAMLYPAFSEGVTRRPHNCQIDWPLVYAPKSPAEPDPDPEISDQAPSTSQAPLPKPISREQSNAATAQAPQAVTDRTSQKNTAVASKTTSANPPRRQPQPATVSDFEDLGSDGDYSPVAGKRKRAATASTNEPAGKKAKTIPNKPASKSSKEPLKPINVQQSVAKSGKSKPRFTSKSLEPTEPPKRSTKKSATAKKAAKKTASKKKDDEEYIRCECGATQLDDDLDEIWVQCEDCGAWQHNRCMGVPDEIPENIQYFCEKCRPEVHKAAKRDRLRRSQSSPPRRPEKRLTRSARVEKRRSPAKKSSRAPTPLPAAVSPEADTIEVGTDSPKKSRVSNSRPRTRSRSRAPAPPPAPRQWGAVLENIEEGDLSDGGTAHVGTRQFVRTTGLANAEPPARRPDPPRAPVAANDDPLEDGEISEGDTTLSGSVPLLPTDGVKFGGPNAPAGFDGNGFVGGIPASRLPPPTGLPPPWRRAPPRAPSPRRAPRPSRGPSPPRAPAPRRSARGSFRRDDETDAEKRERIFREMGARGI